MQDLEVGQIAFLAECYVPGLTQAQVEQALAAIRKSVIDLDSAGRVRCMGSIFVPADEVVFHLFAAPSADAVRVVCARAGLACERIAHSIGLSSTTATDHAVASPRGVRS